MIGDLIILIKTFIRQNILCRHDYKYHSMRIYPYEGYDECEKCGRTKFRY